MRLLYERLKKHGFRETKWQEIQKDQVAGLVQSCCGGENEIHLRFFKDYITAEYEIARKYFSHLFVRPLRANGLTAELIKRKFNFAGELKNYAELLLNRDPAESAEEISIDLKEIKTADPFMKRRRTEKKILGLFASLGLAKSGWQCASFVLFFALLIAVKAFLGINTSLVLPVFAVLPVIKK